MTSSNGHQTTALRVDNTSGKHLSLISIVVSMTIFIFFGLGLLINNQADFAIQPGVAITASILTIVSVVSYFWASRFSSIVQTIQYLILIGLIFYATATTGGASSAFIGLWVIVALFSSHFGKLAMAGTVMALVFQALAWPQDSNLSVTSVLMTYFFVGLLPLSLGYLLWRRQDGHTKSKDPVAELANKLSLTKGKSDVVINTIEDGVFTINSNGIIDLINPSAQTLIGWTQGDALGLDWRSVIKLVNSEGREVAEMENPVAQSLAGNKQIHNDTFFILTSSDKKRLVSIVSTPVSKEGDGTIVVMRDITKQKAEEREQAEFISTASHEMRTPVASIEGYLGLALNPATASIDEKARDYITKAHESAQHLGRLFQDLLDISKSEDGRLKNEPKVINVSAMTGDIAEGLAQMAAAKQLRFIFKPNPSENDDTERRLQPVFYANVDPSHFREVVANLIENAIKYTLQGDVIIDVKGDDKVVTVSVSDSGIGIPAEDIPHLFQKFYRVDNSDTREIGGTGLGLYLCRRLAETMGGTLRVESEYKKGSTFFLDIPRISHEEAMRKLNELPQSGQEIIVDSRPLALEQEEPPVVTSQPVQQVQPTEQIMPDPQYTAAPQAAAPVTAPAPQQTPQVAPAPSMTLAEMEASLSQPAIPSTPQALPQQYPSRVESVNVPPRNNP